MAEEQPPRVDLDEVRFEEEREEEEEEEEGEVQGPVIDVDSLLDDLELLPELRRYRTVGGLSSLKRPAISELLFGRTSAAPQSDEGIRAQVQRERCRVHVHDADVVETRERKGDGVHVRAARHTRRFGMWDGVVARCLLSSFSIIFFLRLGVVMGIAGVGWATVVILLSALIVTLTMLSLSAVITNGQVLPGGVYVLISRALGAQVGGSIGLLFACANAASAALYLIGFADTLNQQTGSDVDGRVWSVVALLVVFGLCMLDAKLVVRVQVAACVFVCAAILVVVIGCLARDEERSDGFVGVRGDVQFRENFAPDWSVGSFLTALGLFFPAMTGSFAGTNMSGDIKVPSRNIPRGTLLSIGVSTATYLLGGWLLAASFTRHDGLIDNFFIAETAALWSPFVQGSVYFGTVAAASASLSGCSKILEAVAHDRLFPSLDVIIRRPVVSYVAGVVIAGLCIGVGDFDSIAPLTAGFFMVSYAAVNLACFFASYSHAPSWRPTFRFYNTWVALAASVLCVVMLVLLSSLMTIVVIASAGALYKYLDHLDPDVDWGSAVESYRIWTALRSLSKLEHTPFHVTNYRPHILIMTKFPVHDKHLVRFSHFLTGSGGALIYGSVLLASWDDPTDITLQRAQYDRVRARARERHNPLVEFGVKGKNVFSKEIIAESFSEGVRALVQVGGPSHLLEVNCLMLGFMENWAENPDQAAEYVKAVQHAFMLRSGVMIVRREDRLFEGPEHRRYRGTIDVWWLFDDGGLSILIPHIISQHRQWKGRCKLRIMTVTVNKRLDKNQVQMSRLLNRLRINAEIVAVDLPVKGHAHEVGTVDESVLRKYEDLVHAPPSRRGLRYMKIAELLRTHSSQAALVVTTMPLCVPGVQPREYLGWLDCLSAAPLPPVLMVRGNQETVLSF